MSIESAKAFYFRTTTDEAFRTQLEQAASKEEKERILQAAGYDFTQEEWQAATAQIQTSTADSELSDAELTAVSGGLSILPGVPDVPGFPITPLYGKPTIYTDDQLTK